MVYSTTPIELALRDIEVENTWYRYTYIFRSIDYKIIVPGIRSGVFFRLGLSMRFAELEFSVK